MMSLIFFPFPMFLELSATAVHVGHGNKHRVNGKSTLGVDLKNGSIVWKSKTQCYHWLNGFVLEPVIFFNWLPKVWPIWFCFYVNKLLIVTSWYSRWHSNIVDGRVLDSGHVFSNAAADSIFTLSNAVLCLDMHLKNLLKEKRAYKEPRTKKRRGIIRNWLYPSLYSPNCWQSRNFNLFIKNNVKG